jgi:hypothetical protein
MDNCNYMINEYYIPGSITTTLIILCTGVFMNKLLFEQYKSDFGKKYDKEEDDDEYEDDKYYEEDDDEYEDDKYYDEDDEDNDYLCKCDKCKNDTNDINDDDDYKYEYNC